MLWAVEPRRVPVTLVVIVVAFADTRPRTVEKTWVHETSAPVHEFSFCVCVLHALRGCVCVGMRVGVSRNTQTI